jgi:hypothetical protein
VTMPSTVPESASRTGFRRAGAECFKLNIVNQQIGGRRVSAALQLEQVTARFLYRSGRNRLRVVARPAMPPPSSRCA